MGTRECLAAIVSLNTQTKSLGSKIVAGAMLTVLLARQYTIQQRFEKRCINNS
jgi:hypothetical protein